MCIVCPCTTFSGLICPWNYIYWDLLYSDHYSGSLAWKKVNVAIKLITLVPLELLLPSGLIIGLFYEVWFILHACNVISFLYKVNCFRCYSSILARESLTQASACSSTSQSFPGQMTKLAHPVAVHSCTTLVLSILDISMHTECNK